MENKEDWEKRLEDLVDKLKAEHNISSKQEATVRTNYAWLAEHRPGFDLDLENNKVTFDGCGVLDLFLLASMEFQEQIELLRRRPS